MPTMLFVALLTLPTLNDFGEKTLFLQPKSIPQRSLMATLI